MRSVFRMLLLFTLLALLYAAKKAKARPTHHENAFVATDKLDLLVVVSSSPRFTSFNDSSALIWKQEAMEYATFADREHTVQVPISKSMLNNGSLFAHVYVSKVGYSPDPKALSTYDRWATTHNIHELVAYGERLKPIGLHNLLSGEPAPWEAELRRGAAEAEASGRPAGEYINYWRPKLHAQLLVDTEAYPIGEMPELMLNYLHGYRLVSGHRYRPLVYINELTSMKIHWQAINGTRSSLPLEMSFGPLPAKRFQWMVNLQHSFKMNEETLGISEKESEDLRGMFVHTNPVLLYTTVAVSAVHLLFDVLAFKSDVSFWNNVDSMEGLSSRSLILNQIMELIVFLYLVEEDSSWLVKVTSVLSLVMGLFKIVKSISVKKKDRVKAAEKAAEAAAKKDAKGAGAGAAAAGAGGDLPESVTEEIDRLAFRYLSPPLVLLVAGFSGYSLYTGYYKSWYSWLIETLVASVYGGGFIVMTPQLFINYRLKSVAHLPWKFFMYKALNTFIDDLFAFIIKMPTLHRMSCFRDDIVFVVFLYQRWVYRVDKSRMNEFGQKFDEAAAEGTSDTKDESKKAESKKSR